MQVRQNAQQEVARPMATSEMNPQMHETYSTNQPEEQNAPVTMEGYTNLSLIKEEDFQKVGMGHMQAAKNSSRRVYVQQNHSNKGGRNHSLNANYQNAPNAFTKGRKASEASTLPGTRHQYKSQDVGRFNTPLKLPNLKSPVGSKKNSSGTNATLKNHHTNLSIVNENKHNAYDSYHQKKKSNSRTITQ